MTITEKLEDWKKLHGYRDPRPMLDSHFYSYLFVNNELGPYKYAEQEEWCNNNLGSDNWHREFNKFWFSSYSDFTLFKLVWFDLTFNNVTQ